jgi:hypothetical protein
MQFVAWAFSVLVAAAAAAAAVEAWQQTLA